MFAYHPGAGYILLVCVPKTGFSCRKVSTKGYDVYEKEM